MISNGVTIQYHLTTTHSWKVMVTKDDAPENITGKTIYFTVKELTSDADPGVFQGTLVIVDGPAGEARLDLAPTDFAVVTQGSYYADIKYIKTADTAVYVIWTGYINLIRAVTRATT